MHSDIIKMAIRKLSTMHEDGAPRLTEEEAAALRADALLEVAEYGYTTMTCDDCSSRLKCALAFDPYNTDGDCLASK